MFQGSTLSFWGFAPAGILILASCAASIAACGGGSDTATGTASSAASSGTGGQSASSTGAGGDAPTADETAAVNGGGTSSAALGQALAVADTLFKFDPTLDPSQTAAQNAAAIQAEVTTALAGCGSVTLNGSIVTINFGAPPGCTFSNGLSVSGSVTAGVTKLGAMLTVALSFTNVVADGKSLNGTASFVTANGSTFTVTTSLTTNEAVDTANVTVTGATGSFTIDGTATSKPTTGVSSTYTFVGLAWQTGQCYPNAGSMTVKTGIISMTLTFSSTTPATGQVMVKEAKKSYSITLPTYGSCPPDGGA